MNRRELLLAGAALTFVPVAAFANGRDYTPGLVAKELAAGKTVFVDFSATWGTTWKAQERVSTQLQTENPAYEQEISFIKVDWDRYHDGELANSLQIPRRSTLVVLKGDAELGRIVAGTSRKAIKQLMDIALGAATS